MTHSKNSHLEIETICVDPSVPGHDHAVAMTVDGLSNDDREVKLICCLTVQEADTVAEMLRTAADSARALGAKEEISDTVH